ncbi:hypothetical protein GGS23DRAFT_302615 [Durotheca rogersii]|uniref:uncharacterized protein n=1 Tax=Durotheca rogersii TaxID=419775 RepID=UPI00222102DA|nr:uncharacterized protein GGS23DRAFT_302615 [Durotheca rogersii]KAI5867041.1 hypothetical protein GGS23DRAFT_302615 [Durotheca rogersii]
MASGDYSRSLPAPPQQGPYYADSYQSPAPPHQQYQRQQYRQQPAQSARPEQSARPVRPAPPTSQPSQSADPQKPHRKSRAFSFHSDRSHKSEGSASHHKVDLHETSAEKHARRLHGKSDPLMALTESEPAMDAQDGGGINPAPLRSIQHKDVYGNPITDPDRSNPTRSRSERPLDTIRAFEAAIDGGYNRKSMLRSESESVLNWDRRASYYGTTTTPRFPQDSYYGARSNSAPRPESAMYDTRQSVVMSGPREGYRDGNNQNGRNRYARMQSDPYMNGRGPVDRNVYPMPNNHRSYETVASGSGSGSTGEPAGYQTDPTSSDNSSIDRRLPPKRQEPANDYGIDFGQPSQAPSLIAGNGSAPPPAPPPSALRRDNGGLLRKSSKASAPNGGSQDGSKAEKRKSWFKRFSRS